MKRRFAARKEEDEARSEIKEEKGGGKLRDKAKELARKLADKLEQMSGFRREDVSDVEGLTRLMYRPTDPASLGVCRALFGLCMVLDVVDERGLSNIDLKWGDPDTCHFPLIHGLKPLPLPWMIILYAVMWLGAFGIMLGWQFKLACGLFAVPYWYVFLLDKSFWNNHSYLYGIVTLLFWGTSANKYFAMDAKHSNKGEERVPYWNYFILKFQFFTLYFIAGLKKSSWEWLEGYSMMNLSRHWVFEPFKLFLSTEQTDFFIVHWFGFIFDLTVGFFMLFEASRIPAMFFCTAFHLMNSRLFSIGMFPYVCLATMPLFCRVDWPRKLRGNACATKSGAAEEASEDERNEQQCQRRRASRRSSDFGSSAQANERSGREGRPEKRVQRTSRRQKFVVALMLCHVALQFFLPYSHFVTKGYNNWVPGLYGYSWDMMVHAWDTVLIVVKVRDNVSQRDYFLDPGAWVPNDRWAKHGDMVKQYAHCIKDNLQQLQKRPVKVKGPWGNLSSDISIYVDVWCSLNGRFQQRLFNPNVDILKAEWHPLKPIPYLMPLLRQFSSYRTELERIQRDVFNWSNYTDVLFVADYPRMQLENYIDGELSNVTLSVLEGEVAYREDEEEGCDSPPPLTIARGGAVRIEAGRFHRVETTSPHPACYMYTFANRTKQQLADRGIREPVKLREQFPVLKELGYRIDGFGRAFGHILNAVLHLTFDVPMIRRVSLD